MIIRGESTIIDYHAPFDQGFIHGVLALRGLQENYGEALETIKKNRYSSSAKIKEKNNKKRKALSVQDLKH